MKISLGIIALACLFSVIARGGLGLQSPDDLLSLSSQGRIPLREVILNIEANISEMRDPATFDSYFNLLDQLQGFATQFHLDDIYPGAVEKLGHEMAGQGIRWLDLTKDDTSRVLHYVKWMDLDGISRVENQAEYNQTDQLTAQEIRTLATNVAALIPVADLRFKDDTSLSLGLRRVSSDLAVKYLTTVNISDADAEFWISKIQLWPAMESYIDFLNQQMSKIQSQNRTLLHMGLARFFLIQRTLESATVLVPLSLSQSVADSIQNLILQFVQLEEPFKDGEFENALLILQIPQLKALAQSWEGTAKLPSSSYGEALLYMGRELVNTLNKNGQTRDAFDLGLWLNSQTALIKSTELDLEGLYQLKDGNGKLWYFTIAQARENLLYAALSDADGFVTKLFFNVAFDVQDGQFTASDREPDLDGTPNPTIQFSVDKSGKIVLQDMYIRDLRMMELKGQKTQSFPNLLTQTLAAAPPIAGVYEGQISFPTPGGQKNIGTFKTTLVVTPFNGYTIGRLMLDTGKDCSMDIQLNTGTKGTNGVLYLTSVKNYLISNESTWTQLRVVATKDGLKGYVIVGGRGMSNTPFTMKKVK